MATWHSDIEMEETGCGGKGSLGRGGASGGGAARGCIRVRHYTGASYRDSGEIKFCISEYKNDAFQVCVMVKELKLHTINLVAPVRRSAVNHE